MPNTQTTMYVCSHDIPTTQQMTFNLHTCPRQAGTYEIYAVDRADDASLHAIEGGPASLEER